MSKTRNASFELLRIICMFMIVLYHLFVKLDYSGVCESAFYSTMLFPLHIAVICFVLMSGYFGIQLSFKKLLSFYIQVLFYNIVVYSVCSIISNEFTVKNFIISFLPLSHNQDLWFIRTYLYLMLLSPIINKYLSSAPPEKFKVMLAVLVFISVYLGIKSDDQSLKEGKNITNFILIYFIGHGIRHKIIVGDYSLKKDIAIFLTFNLSLLSIYYMTFGHGVASFIHRWGWGYNSPLLILNAVLLFMVFTKLTIKANFISIIAKSVFPIYLIHSNLNVQKLLWPFIKTSFDMDSILIRNIFWTLFIMSCCVIIDRYFAPIYRKISDYSINLFQKYEKDKILNRFYCKN